MPRSTKCKPQKPRPDFPLTAHPNGQWVKWIKPKGASRRLGKIICFGPWGDPAAAEELYLHERADWEAGRDPRAVNLADERHVPSLEEVADRWLIHQHDLMTAGVLSYRSFMDKKRAVKEMFRHWSRAMNPMRLTPDDFGALRRKLGEGVGPSALGQRIIHVRAMFRWAGPDNQRLLPGLPRWGDQFRNTSEAERVGARDDNEDLHGPRVFTRAVAQDIIRRAYEQATEAENQAKEPGQGTPRLIAARWFLAATLIAANTGANAADIAALSAADVDLVGKKWIKKTRVKTRRSRIPWWAPLWRETRAAIIAYLAVRPSANPVGLAAWRSRRMSESSSPKWKMAAQEAEPLFLTADGFPLVHEQPHFDDQGLLTRNTPIDAVGLAMGKMLRAMKLKKPGLNFGAWRHTFKTVAEETGREMFIKRVMGHTVGKICARYFKPSPKELRAVTNHVRRRLLPKEYRASAIKASGEARRSA